MIASESL